MALGLLISENYLIWPITILSN